MKKFIPYLLGLICLYSCVGTGEKKTHFTLTKVREMAEEVRMQFIPDRRVGIFDVECTVRGKNVTLKGETTSSEAGEMLVQRLREEGYSLTDSILILPDSQALEGKTYGIVNLSVCNIRTKNDFSSEMVTQALLGMPVKILQHKDWYRIKTPDNYIGWVHRAGVTPLTPDEYNTWNQSEKVVVTSHYGFAYEKTDSNSQTVSDVVAGDRLKLEGEEREYYKVSYPDGRKAYIHRSVCKAEKAWRASLKQDAESIIRTARSLLGVPYLWAGTSSKGMDCSGFVRTVLYMHDIIMPRDASQQAYVGTHIDIAPDFSNLIPGDLIFFGRKATPERKERVVHVAIYIGGKKFIHSQGDVRINSFDPADSDYDEFNLNRLLFATRFLDSVNQVPEINTTATNPYYLPQ